MKRRHPAKSDSRPASKSPSKAAHDYAYRTLKSLLRGELDRVNVYAVVLDCSGTYYVKRVDKYVCTIKLIDETLNPHAGGGYKFMNVTMFSRSASKLPQPAKIGSVLRIHRGQTKINKDEIQMNCDVGIKGAWVLFDPVNNVMPVSESGKSHTFTSRDEARLKDIRKFAEKYFKAYALDGTSLDAAHRGRLEEFDTICYVLDVKKKRLLTKVLLCDKSKVAKVFLPHKHPLPFAPSAVVRFRSASHSACDGKIVLKFNDYSNIIGIPEEYKSAVDMKEIIKSEKTSREVLDKLKNYTHDLSTSVISHPTIKRPKIVHLKDLYSGSLLKSKEKLFRVKVNVMEVGPKNPADWVCAESKNCHGPKEKSKGLSVEYYLKLQLFVKDVSVSTDNNLYTIFVCTADGKGKEFIKVPQGNKKPDQEYFKKLKKIYKTLIKPWSILDCIVERINAEDGQSLFFLVNTCLDLN
eukprot:TRINITY_DN3579_c0_g1_i8.p1 TRINITY_DN3579_c0_g1~~TRINITY_DN3579_c0_g1_i8.p1  ORF type:complete len:465 (+),score=99.23 TRINITY_DN3579_c0_g1_i8:125-1519(+)